MNAIFTYSIRQLLNYWHSLRLRVRFEIIFLFIVFYTFFTGKFISYVHLLLLQPDTSPTGLCTLIVHIHLLVVVLSTPFIYLNLFPKQKGLLNLSIYPLKKSDAFVTLMTYFVKYQMIIILIVTPVYTALALSTGILMLTYILLFSCSSVILSALLVLILVSINQSRLKIFILYFSTVFIYLTFFVFLYITSDFYFLYSILVIICGWILLLKSWNKQWQSWDLMLNRFRPFIQRSNQYKTRLTYFKFPRLLPKIVQPLFIKEILSHIRNKNYMRLKIISLAIYMAVLILVDIYYHEYYTNAVAILSLMLIWEHYSHQFNDKYVTKESSYLIKVMPVKFYQYCLSKIFGEFIYILLILIVVLIATIIHGISLQHIFIILLIISLFSLFVLYTITLIHIIFYDNPRTSGYAYHFLVIFTLIMNFQYYLVGPLMTLFILIYLHFKSYRQFVR